MKLNEENVNLIHTNLKEKIFFLKLALAIISMSNNSQTNVTNVVKFASRQFEG